VAARQPEDDPDLGPRSRSLAKTVDDNGGCYIVPAFSGLFAPYWKSDARGVFAGLTRFVNAGTSPVRRSRRPRSRAARWSTPRTRTPASPLESLKVDGGHGGQRNAHAVPGRHPRRAGDPAAGAETTALGAAYAAGLATGLWDNVDDLRQNWVEEQALGPEHGRAKRAELYKYWKKAVTRTFDWLE
jgi:glycerol kinase